MCTIWNLYLGVCYYLFSSVLMILMNVNIEKKNWVDYCKIMNLKTYSILTRFCCFWNPTRSRSIFEMRNGVKVWTWMEHINLNHRWSGMLWIKGVSKILSYSQCIITNKIDASSIIDWMVSNSKCWKEGKYQHLANTTSKLQPFKQDVINKKLKPFSIKLEMMQKG